MQRQSFPAREELETLTRETLVKEYPALASLVEKEEAGIHRPKPTIQSASPRNAALDSVEEVSGLPRVLLIGNSISIGYTLQVRELLRGKANVQRIQENGRASEYGLANLATWLGRGKWDVIHFNFGIHDAKFISPATARVPRDQYAANLRALIDRMKVTGARLIFATTTPLPNGGVISPSPAYDDIPARNEIALGIMRENDIAIDDLYAIALPHLANVGRANNVHFKPEGYELLAKAVAESIERHLPVQIGMEPTTPEGSVRFSFGRPGIAKALDCPSLPGGSCAPAYPGNLEWGSAPPLVRSCSAPPRRITRGWSFRGAEFSVVLSFKDAAATGRTCARLAGLA